MKLVAFVAFSAVLVVSGCNDGESDAEPSPSGSARGALYAISTNVFSPDDITGYVSLVPSLDDSETVDLRDAIEFPGGANAVGMEGQSSVYVGLWSSPIIERWDLQRDGTLEPGMRISFADFGVGDVSSVAFTDVFSPQKSYFVDEAGKQLVTWNPSKMEALGTIPLPLENEGALAPRLMSYLTVRPDMVLVNSFMTDPDDWTKYSDRSRLLAIDPKSDEVINVDEWVGCEKVQLAGQTSDGTAYYTADNMRTFIRHVLGSSFGTSPCGLRVVPAGMTFDQGYDVNLSQLVGGRPVAGDLAVVSDDMAFLRVWHDEDVGVEVNAENFQDVYSSVRAFRWWSWKIGASEATEIPDQVPQSGFADRFTVDGRTFIADNSAIGEDAGGNAPLIELRPDGTLGRGLTAKGQVGGKIVRLR